MRKWKNHNHQYTWKTIVAGLSCVVAVSTICALTLPAIAMDSKCGLEEHQHTDTCYAQLSSNQQEKENLPADNGELMQNTVPEDTQVVAVEETEKVLICQIPEHIHADACRKIQEEIPTETEQTQEPTAVPQTQATENQQSEARPDELTETPQESTVPATMAAAPDEQVILGENVSEFADAEPEETVPEITDAKPEKTVSEIMDAEPVETADEETADLVGEKTPIDVNEYVEKARLRYKDKASDSGAEWQDMQEGVNIPGDAKLRLDIEYEHVPISKLIASGCQLSFEVPKIMRNPVAQGEIKDENHATVGSITSSGHMLTLTFEQSWLEHLQDTNNGVLNGTFYVQSEIDLSEVPTDDGALDIVFGDVHITPSFDTDSIAKFGQLEISKSVSKTVISENDVHYLEYTLTVTAGEDGSPDVKVVDYFENNGEYAEYVGVTPIPTRLSGEGIPREGIQDGREHGWIYQGGIPTESQPIPPENGTDIAKSGSLVWKIGNMNANEQRTLTYRVKLSDQHEDKITNEPLRNRAKVYSKTYKKNDAVADFTPQVDLDMRKSHSSPVRNPEDGSHKITYTVWFEAPSSNNHVLGEVQVKDSLKITNEKALPHIRYDEASFKLYHSKQAEGTPMELNKSDGSFPKLQYTKDGQEFTVSVGDMAPGEAYCMQYDVIVDAKAFGAANVDLLTVKNRVVATADNAQMPGKDYIQGFNDNCDLGYKNWIKKNVSDPLGEALTVDLPQNNVYDATSGTIVAESNPPQNFNVPAGSYPYTITFNHLGDWDITEAVIKDTLSKNYIQYTGYLRVDAFNTKGEGSDPLGALVETHWVKIGGMNAFQLRLSDIGFADNTYAYQFTYYASAVNVGTINKVNVSNTANIVGTVVKDGEKFQIGGFSSEAEISIQGGYAIEAVKKEWYYQKPNVSTGVWSNGAIYWGIQIDGSQLHEGTVIKDFVKTEGAHHERGNIYFRSDSFVGIYKGNLPDGVRFNDYADVQSLVGSGHVSQLSTEDYCEITYKDELNFNRENTYSAVYVKMRKSIPLENNESVFLILRSEPDPLPSGTRTKKLYTNYLDVGSSEDTMVNYGMATKVLYGGQNILKEFGTFFKFDGKNITNLETGRLGNVPKALLKNPGHYIAWASKVNYGGDLAGRYRVVDQIPEGMEIAFARLKWIGEKTRNSGIQMAQIPDYQRALGPGWTEHSVQAELDSNLGNRTSYYYTNGDQVLWEVENLVAGHEMDVYAVDFQIVCRVTDPEVLQGGIEKEFVNQVYLQHTDGTQMDSSSSGVKVSVKTIDKTSATVGNSIHFTIAVNPNGEDLLKGGDTITLVDEMSQTLSLDVESIRVVNSRTNETVPVKPAYDNQTLMIPVPDNQPLTITYITHIHAVPDTHITLSNNAYWMGYSQNGGDSVVIENFHYTIGGTAGGDGTPKVQILKYDKNDITHYLPGAQFQMEEGTMENGVFQGNGEIWTGTTGSDGTLTFGTDNRSDKPMKYNTVYRIQETRAPEGYVLDADPYDFIVAKKVDDQYPPYPEGVHVHYASAIHVFKAPNSRGEVTVEKQFQNVDGTAINPIPGEYRFGLFDNPEGTGKPLQIVTLKFTETTANQKGTFVDLNLGEKYYVYELDEDSNPILPGTMGYVNRTPFQVAYKSDSGMEVHAVTDGFTITITNKLCIDSLPETGGIGTEPYVLAGLVLMCSAMWMAYCHSKKRKCSQ